MPSLIMDSSRDGERNIYGEKGSFELKSLKYTGNEDVPHVPLDSVFM